MNTPRNYRLPLVALMITASLGLGPASRAQPASQIGDWSGVQNWPIEAIHSVMLPTGKVMVWQTWTDSIALWDPADGSFTDAANPNVNIFCSGHAWLPDGRLMVVGGHISDANGEEEANIYDPWTDTWANNVPDMNFLNQVPNHVAGRWYPGVTTLGTGEILALSGHRTNYDDTNPLPQVYNATTNTWRDLTSANKTNMPSYPRTFLLPDGDVVSLSNYGGVTDKLSTGGTGSWAYVDHTPGIQDLHNYGPAVMYDAGKIAYFGGGDSPSDRIRLIDFNDPNAQWTYNAQDMAQPRRQNDATILADGTVLITGGTTSSGFNNPQGSIATAEVWDPVTGSVSQVDAASNVFRGYHSTATLLPDATVLITGGNHDDGGYVENRNAEIYSPAYLFNGPRPTITTAPAAAALGDTIFVETPDYNDIAKALMIVPGATTHSQNWTQRANLLDFSVGANGINIDLPENPNHAPPGNYMLFLVNNAGVPSIANWLMAELPAAEPGLNLLTNAGFDAAGGSVDDWSVFGASGSNISANTRLVQDGTHALKIYPQFAGEETWSGVAQGAAITEGATVRAEASVRIPSWDTLNGTTNDAEMRIEFYSVLGAARGSEDFIGEFAISIADGTVLEDLWIDHELEVVAPGGAVEARLVFHLHQPNGDNGAIWIDNAGLFQTIAEIIGDYNGSGQVEQGDLDLVLQNWGVDVDAAGIPTGWTSDLPSGQIEQTELDRVLQNWGATSSPDFSNASIPEPGAAILVLGGIVVGARRIRSE